MHKLGSDLCIIYRFHKIFPFNSKSHELWWLRKPIFLLSCTSSVDFSPFDLSVMLICWSGPVKNVYFLRLAEIIFVPWFLIILSKICKYLFLGQNNIFTLRFPLQQHITWSGKNISPDSQTNATDNFQCSIVVW